MSSPIVAVAVSPVPAAPSTRGSKRKITPSAERSASKRILLLTTPSKKNSSLSPDTKIAIRPEHSVPRQLFPGNQAIVTQQYSHAHPEPAAHPAGNASWQNRHVVLPYDLRGDKVDIFDAQVQDLLRTIFPSTQNVTQGRFRSHLQFQFDQIPKGPWPLTVGGVPITIHELQGDRGRALMLPIGPLGNPAIHICQQGHGDLFFTDNSLRKLAAEVDVEYRNRGFHVVELMYACDRLFRVVLPDSVKYQANKSQLPGKIAGRQVAYLNEGDLHRPAWADLSAKREIEPQHAKGIIDDTAYDPLRPGVLMSSTKHIGHIHPQLLSTTTGVLVQNSAGHRFMTGASHGIGQGETVFQPKRKDKIIGKAVVEISFADIALIQLENGVSFINETFEAHGGKVPSFSRFTTSDEKYKMPDAVFLNSPYTGNMEGAVVQKSVLFAKNSKHPVEANQEYIMYNWAYMGQVEDNEDMAKPPDGTCGSVIWDNEGVIQGFYRYYVEEGQYAGFSVFVSASEAEKAGYTLAKA